MDNWDSENADNGHINVAVIKSKWEGEDEDEDVMDSWDQEPEEEKEEEPPKPTVTSGKKAPKPLVDSLYESKFKSKNKRNDLPKEESKVLTPEEILAEKLRQQKLQEESDLTLAKEVFGVLGQSGLDSKEDFDKFKDEILKIVNDANKNTNFVNFTEELIHSLCLHLCAADLKKIHTWIGNLNIEKAKLEKGEKSKKSKGKGKAKLRLEGDNAYDEYSAFTAEDFDDFI